MFLSIIMLVAVSASWLLKQYNEQKEELAKDLNANLKFAKDKITGKLLYNKYIDTALRDSKITIHSDRPVVIKKTNDSVNGIAMIINTEVNDSVHELKLRKHITTLRKYNDSVITWSSVDTQRAVMVNTPDDSIRRVVKPIIEMVLRQAVTDDLTKDLNFRLDTNALIKIFKTETDKIYTGFAIISDSARYYYTAHISKPILLKNTFFSTQLYVVVDNYSYYLLRKISPQILFTIFLLLVTSAAFLFTYKALKDQIRLGIIKNEFISNMSHELKTPVSTVKVALEAINNFQPITDTQTIRDYLQMATLETERLEMLINQSLNVSLIEQGRMTLQKERYDIVRLLHKTLQAMQVRIRQANARIEKHTPMGELMANIDVLHIQGALINLVDNSLKYSTSNPLIIISIKEETDHILVSVADNGPGIPREYVNKVFDKFFRVPGGDKHNVKGYGLGLSYVKEVIEQHGGSITVSNLDPGCIFTIKLPKA